MSSLSSLHIKSKEKQLQHITDTSIISKLLTDTVPFVSTMTKNIVLTLITLGLSQLWTIQAFVVPPNTMKSNTPSKSTTFMYLNRRESIQTIIGITAGVFIQKQAVDASGGATAGGSYLISAKQRYNNRVKEGIKKFVLLESDLEKKNINSSVDYFTSESVGSWKDTSTAGYLLANAFRTSSAKPPDSLPAVKVRMPNIDDIQKNNRHDFKLMF